MDSASPLTRCKTCNTVFEVPQGILDSADSRVRCGECLQVFDAREHLYEVEQADFSVLTEPESQVAGNDGTTGDAEDLTESPYPALPTPEQFDAGAGNDLTERAADIDLLGPDADLPLASFEDNTIDALQLDLDIVDDYPDETFGFGADLYDETGALDEFTPDETSDTDYTRNLTDQSDDQANVTDTSAMSGDQHAVRRRNARFAATGKRDFSLDESDTPALVEFDFRDGDGDATVVHPIQLSLIHISEPTRPY